MSKMTNVLYGIILLIGLNACGTSTELSDYTQEPIGESYEFVDILELEEGYIIRGENIEGNEIVFEFCLNNYLYYTATDSWSGIFSIRGDRINMFDKTPAGGSYRMDTINNLLEVGEMYSIDFQNNEILIDEIVENLDCH